MLYGPEAECLGFIDWAESTFIPWTVSGYSDQQAVCLARRPDGSLLKSVIVLYMFHSTTLFDSFWLFYQPV
jgi:hypothetical protein